MTQQGDDERWKRMGTVTKREEIGDDDAAGRQ